MPWHEEYRPKINYETKDVEINGKKLRREKNGYDNEIQIGNIGVRKFRSLLRKNKNNLEVYMEQNIETKLKQTQNPSP